METVIGIAFIVFVLVRVLLGKDNEKPKARPRHFVRRDDEDEKYPPSYY